MRKAKERRKPAARPAVRPPSRARRLAVLVGLLAVGTVVLFAADVPTAFCLARTRSALDESDLSGAVRWADRAERLGGRDAEAAFVRARLERKLGRLDAAAELLRRAGELGHDRDAVDRESLLVAAQGGALPRPEESLARLLGSGEDAREVAEAFARGYILAYRLDDAARLLDTWRRDDPGDPEPHYLGGRILEYRTDLIGAEESYRAALAAASHHAAAAYGLGRVLSAAQKREAALVAYEACAAESDDPRPAQAAAARCLRELGRLDEARAMLARASAASPEPLESAYRIVGEPTANPEARLEEEWGLLELAAENWGEAERRLRAALDADPRNWRLRYSLATALRQRGRAAEADEQLGRFNRTKAELSTCDHLYDVLRKNPGDADARYRVGKVLYEHVSEEQGLVWLRSVLEYRPDHVETHRTLAEIYAGKAGESADFVRLADRHRRAAAEAAASDSVAR